MIRVRVREAAQAQDLDIAKLARRADLSYATVYKVWHEQLTDKGVGLLTLYKIARALGMRVVDLIEETDRRTRQLAAARETDTNWRARDEVAGVVSAIPALHP